MTVVIAISGPHGTGKSTLAHQLVAALKLQHKSVGLVTESARSSQYLASGDRGPEMHLEVFGLHLVREMRAMRNYPIVICDRSIYDFLAYARVRFDPLSYVPQCLSAFGRNYASRYHLILKTTAVYDNPDRDLLRASERTTVADMDAALSAVYNDFGISVTSLPTTDAFGHALRTILETIERRPSA